MNASVIEAYEVLAFTEVLQARVKDAAANLSGRPGFTHEKQWLSHAVTMLAHETEGVPALLKTAVKLPELAALREEHAETFQNAVIDVVERLQAGITFQHGSRSPLLEALFGKLKLPQLRRADRETFETFSAEFEKRLNTGYAKRMLADPGFAFALPVVDQWRQSVAAWRTALAPQALESAEESALRDQLIRAAADLEVPLQQVRLLAQAALAPMKNAFDESGIGAKPRRKVKTATATPGASVAPAAETAGTAEAPGAVAAPAEAAPAPGEAVTAAPPQARKPRKKSVEAAP